MNKKSDNQPVTGSQLKSELKKVEKKLSDKIDQREAVLRAEIRISAQETKDDIKEEVRSGNQKILTTIADFAKEVRDSREERTVVSHQLLKLASDVEKIKERVFAD